MFSVENRLPLHGELWHYIFRLCQARLAGRGRQMLSACPLSATKLVNTIFWKWTNQFWCQSAQVVQGSLLGPLKFMAYTEDLTNTITSYQLNYHLYADDTQLIVSWPVADIGSTNERLLQCVAATQHWCSSRRLQSNPSKTELIWFGTRCSLQKIAASDR